jgi:hypothetical protein
LLFGSKDRDLALAMRAIVAAGVERAVALANEDDVGRVAEAARTHGAPVRVLGPLGPMPLRDLVCSAKIVINPIVPPSESHYSLAVPLAVGRGVVTTRSEAATPFVVANGGVVAVEPGDVDAWRAAIRAALHDHAALGARALVQAQQRHDLDRFFLSALEATLAR